MAMQISSLLDPSARAARAMHKAAQQQIRDTQRLLRRAGARVGEKAKGEVRQCVNELEKALRRGGDGQLEKSAEKLQKAVDKHLAMCRKPAWRESAESVAVAIMVALLLRAFVVEAFKIPSGSMIPTLSIGDQIFVNKFVYGIRIPFTSIRLVNFSMPERGDVVVFICPEWPNEDYIKRIVGLPGDEIVVRRSVVYVNGEPQTHEALGKTEHWDRESTTGQWHPFEALSFKETLGNNTHVVLQEVNPMMRHNDFGPYRVPEGHVFAMGDNRDRSHDSRAWGPVPLSNILGRAMFVWWSWGHKTPDWDRLGKWIE